MTVIIATKQIGRKKAGSEVTLPASQARVFVALGHGYYKPKVIAPKAGAEAPRRLYQRRDMVAETAAQVPAEPPKPSAQIAAHSAEHDIAQQVPVFTKKVGF
jgi:hypothetical protein